MRTKQQLKNKIAELEQWLRDNPGHPNQLEVRHNLQIAKDELITVMKNE